MLRPWLVFDAGTSNFSCSILHLLTMVLLNLSLVHLLSQGRSGVLPFIRVFVIRSYDPFAREVPIIMDYSSQVTNSVFVRLEYAICHASGKHQSRQRPYERSPSAARRPLASALGRNGLLSLEWY